MVVAGGMSVDFSGSSNMHDFPPCPLRFKGSNDFLLMLNSGYLNIAHPFPNSANSVKIVSSSKNSTIKSNVQLILLFGGLIEMDLTIL